MKFTMMFVITLVISSYSHAEINAMFCNTDGTGCVPIKYQEPSVSSKGSAHLPASLEALATESLLSTKKTQHAAN